MELGIGIGMTQRGRAGRGRINLLRSTELFSAVEWGKADATVAASLVVPPTGTGFADKLSENAATASHYLNQDFPAVLGTTYTCSQHLKAADFGFALLAVTQAFPTTAVQVNLTTGAVTTGVGSPLTVASVNKSNGWWRVNFSVAATSTANGLFNTYISTDGLWANRSHLGTLGSGIHPWGPQVEAGPVSAYQYVVSPTDYGA